MSYSHASGSKCRKTSPSNPPTAKLRRVFRNFDSAAENEEGLKSGLKIIFMLLCGITKGWKIV
jgi:hypothetical protein